MNTYSVNCEDSHASNLVTRHEPHACYESESYVTDSKHQTEFLQWKLNLRISLS